MEPQKQQQQQQHQEQQVKEKENHPISNNTPSPRSMDSSPPQSYTDPNSFWTPVHSPQDPPPQQSPSPQQSPPPSPPSPPPQLETAPPAKLPSPVTVVNRSVRDESMLVTKVDPGAVNLGVVEEGTVGGGGGGRSVNRSGVTGSGGGGGDDGGGRRSKPTLLILKRPRRDSMLRRVAFGLRLSEVVLCLVSFSVMASDKNKGWSLDSFDRYKEFRYCLSVNVIGFVYSGYQAFHLAFHLTSGKYVGRNQLRHFFDFFMDQMLTYLLISASSSAATRVEDWESNWGKDKFPDMAKASVVMSFLAFVAFASSSLISGYSLCTNST